MRVSNVSAGVRQRRGIDGRPSACERGMMKSAPIAWHTLTPVMVVVGTLGQLIGCYFDTQGQFVEGRADAATQDVGVDSDSRRDTGRPPCTTFECDGVCVQLGDPQYGCAWGRCTPCRQPRNPATEEVTCFEQECVSVCKGAYASCDPRVEGCPIDLNTDVQNCDRCGRICVVAHGTAACHEGQCRIARCDEGFANCNWNTADRGYSDGCETDQLNDKAHCGKCDNNCDKADPTRRTKYTCRNGTCEQSACENGWGDCFPEKVGCETDLNVTVEHCGQCRFNCRALPNVNVDTVTCQRGRCVIAAGDGGCKAGHGNCDGRASNGCEVELLRDVNHCGKCNNKCAAGPGSHSTSPKCENGKCVHSLCDVGYGDCNAAEPPMPDDGCETDTTKSSKHCGGCDKQCNSPANHAHYKCSSWPDRRGSCVVESCDTGYHDCDKKPENGCEKKGACPPPG